MNREPSDFQEIKEIGNSEITPPVAVVTGGTKGIGQGIVLHLIKNNYTVFTNYSSDKDAAYRLIEDCKKYPGRLHILRASQNSYESFLPFINLIRSHNTSINCIICNSGATIRKSSFVLSNEDWEKVMNVNLNSHFYLIRDLNELIAHNSRIIFIGSLLGKFPHATSLPYGVAKSAVHSLAQNLVKDFADSGTTVNVIAPGFIDTEWQKNKPIEIRNNICKKTALGRFGEIQEVVNAVSFCINNPFINGAVIDINGGYSFK